MNKMNNRIRYENCFISHDHDVLYWQLVVSSYWFFSDEGVKYLMLVTYYQCSIYRRSTLSRSLFPECLTRRRGGDLLVFPKMISINDYFALLVYILNFNF